MDTILIVAAVALAISMLLVLVEFGHSWCIQNMDQMAKELFAHRKLTTFWLK